MKYWTHLEEGGRKQGGQHKVELVPERFTGLHLKSGLYKGAFKNIKHAQLINKTTKSGDGIRFDWRNDKRIMFDNRLTDDAIRAYEQADRTLCKANFDCLRPANTLSCPQLGADFV